MGEREGGREGEEKINYYDDHNNECRAENYMYTVCPAIDRIGQFVGLGWVVQRATYTYV